MVKTNKGWNIAANIVMVLLSFLALAPFVLLIIASLTDEGVAMSFGYSYFPQKWSTSAYQYIASQAGRLGRAYMMTIIVTAVGTGVGVMITALLGYMLSNPALPGRKWLNLYVVFTMLFNGGLVPTYIMYVKTFAIKNTIFGLIVPNLLCSAFLVMLVRNYFENSIPRDLYEAARIDGANGWDTFWHITVPQLRPVIIMTFIMSINGTLQLFDESVNLTNGGPANTTITMSHYIYNNALGQGVANFGYASALSFIVFIMVAILAFINLKVGDTRD